MKRYRLTVWTMVAAAAAVMASVQTVFAQHGCGGGSGGSHSGQGGMVMQEPQSSLATIEDGVQVAEITVTSSGFMPSRIILKDNLPVRLMFYRVSSSACVAELLIPSLGIERIALQQGKSTPVSFAAPKAGEYQFTCGMEMLGGSIVVEATKP